MPARIKFELSQASHHARATHSQPASAHARKKPTHNSRSLTLLTSLPTGLDLALGKEVKNLNLLDLSVVGHPRFSVRLLVGLSAVTLPHYNSHHSTTSSTLLLPPLSPQVSNDSVGKQVGGKSSRLRAGGGASARPRARACPCCVQVGSRAAAETPIPSPSRPARARFCLLAGVRHARARGGKSPPQRRLTLEPAPASCLARPVPARLSQERTRTAGAGPCSPALARVLAFCPQAPPRPLPHPPIQSPAEGPCT